MGVRRAFPSNSRQRIRQQDSSPPPVSHDRSSTMVSSTSIEPQASSLPLTAMAATPLHRPFRPRGSIPMVSASSCLRLACLLLMKAAISTATQSSTSSTFRNIYVDSSGRAINASHHYPFFRDEEEQERKIRMQERRRRAREFLERNPSPPPSDRRQLVKMTDEQVRKLGWFGGGSTSTDLYSSGFLADPSQTYDKWAQAYRMLGVMIDCDHAKDEGSHDNNKNNNNDQGGSSQTCSRWMLWAAYVNPNYEGNGYDEYYGEEPTSTLDCHNPNSDWVLLGVYRQEFYQFIEQVSKHLWGYTDYEYVVAVAGLKYMTDADCFQVGSSSSGTALYAGVQPLAYGKWQMGLYTDDQCIQPDTSSGMTYDDFGMTSSVNIGGGSHDNNNGDDDSNSWAYDWWTSSQEYTLTNLNNVYEEYKYCTTCVDYPTYQDGYFIGDDGTDDDDLINQCWKFYSHDSYTCEAECIAKAHAQGTILFVDYGEVEFGKTMNSFYTVTNKQEVSASTESPLQRLLANAALTASFLLFVATFLAFAVARRSRFRDARSARTRRLLDDDDEEGRSRRSKRSSKSGSGAMEPTGDGLFKVERSSKSPGRKSSSHKSSSKTRSSSAKGSSSRKHKSRSRSYEPPAEARPPRSERKGGGADGGSGGTEEYH